MVRETRHLWVGNLPDNIREERILEHFKRYGRVQSVKILPKKEDESGICATVAFIDIKSASKAHGADNKIEERTLKTDYYEPPTPITATTAIHIHERDDTLLRTAGLYNPVRNQRYPHGLAEERGYERSSHYYERGPDRDPYSRRPMSYHEDEVYQGRGRPRDRNYRAGTTTANFQAPMERTQGHYRSHNSRQHFDQQRYTPGTDQYVDERETVPGRVSRRPSRSKSRHGRQRQKTASRSQSGSGSDSHSRSGSRSSCGSRSSSSSSNTRSSSSSGSSQSHSGSGSRSQSRSQSPSSRSSSKTSRPSDKPASMAAATPQLQSAVSTPAPVVCQQVISQPSGNTTASADSSSGEKEEKRPLGICVRNLPVRSSDTSLKDGLFHEYKKHGKVTTVKVIGQGTDRYAVVCFKKPEDVEKALEVSKDKLFFGSKIEVTPHEGLDVDDHEFRPIEAELDEYHPKATRTLFIGNLEKDISTAELMKHFEQFGEIIEIDIKKQGAVSSYAFVQYSDITSVVKALRKMDGEHLGANRIKLGFGKSMPTNCVWLDGVADTVSEKFLTRQFVRFGPVVSTYIDREKGHTLIFYERGEYAQIAVPEMRGRALGGKKLQIDFASRECQIAFFEKMEMSGQLLPGERPWDRRDQNFDGREERDPRIVYEASGRGFSRFENQQRGRASFRGTTRGTFNNRGRGQAFSNRNYDEEFSQGSGTSYDDSYEQELREYGFSQRERRDYGSDERSVRGRSFSPRRRLEDHSMSPKDRHADGLGTSPHPRVDRPSRFERYDSGREDEGSEDKRTKFFVELDKDRPTKKSRHRSISDHESYHSQSPPNSRHQSRSISPPLKEKRHKERTGNRPHSPGTPLDSPNRDGLYDTSLDRDTTTAEYRDSSKRKLSENRVEIRDPVRSDYGVGELESCSRTRTKLELDRAKFHKVHSEEDGGERLDHSSESTPSFKDRNTLFRLNEVGKLPSVIGLNTRSQKPSTETDTLRIESDSTEKMQVDDNDNDRESGELVDDFPEKPPTETKDLKHLQKEKVHILHLLEQLEDNPSSSDETGLDVDKRPSKRLKVIERGELISEVNRHSLKDTKEIQHSNRCKVPDVDSDNLSFKKQMDIRKISEQQKHSEIKNKPVLERLESRTDENQLEVDVTYGLDCCSKDSCTDFILKRRKHGNTSDEMNHNKHNYCTKHCNSESICNHNADDDKSSAEKIPKIIMNSRSLSLKSPDSKPGTPLVDEPRREKDSPLSLPLPRFASSMLSPKHSPKPLKSPPLLSPTRSNISLINTNVVRDLSKMDSGKLPPTISISPPNNEKKSPNPSSESRHKSPSASSPKGSGLGSSKSCSLDSSSDSEHSPKSSPNRPSLDERIRIFEENYNAWSGSTRNISNTICSETLTNKIDYEKYTIKKRPSFLSTDITRLRTEPSDIVKSLLAKNSIFDQDSKRLEHINEKYEPRDICLDSLPKKTICFRTKAAAKEFSPIVSTPRLCVTTTSAIAKFPFSSTSTTSPPSNTFSSVTTHMTVTSSTITPASQTNSSSNTSVSSQILSYTVPFSSMNLLSTTSLRTTECGIYKPGSATSARKPSDPPKTPILKKECSTSGIATTPTLTPPLRLSLSSTPSVTPSPSTTSTVTLPSTVSIKKEPISSSFPLSRKELVPTPNKKDIKDVCVKKETVNAVTSCIKDSNTIKKENQSSSNPKDDKQTVSLTKDVKKEIVSSVKDSFIKKESVSSSSTKETSSRRDSSQSDSMRESSKKDSKTNSSGKEIPLRRDSSQGSSSNKRRLTSVDSSESESSKSSKIESKVDKDSKTKSDSKVSEPEMKKMKLSSNSSDDKKKSECSTSPNSNKKSSKSGSCSDKKQCFQKQDSKSDKKEEKKVESKSTSEEKSKSESLKSKDDKKAKSQKDSKSDYKSKSKSSTDSKSKEKDKRKDKKKDRKDKDKSDKEKSEKDKSDKDKEKLEKDKPEKDKSKEKKGSEKSKSDTPKHDKKADKMAAFAFIEEEPVYFSMYDKVKARSSQNEKAKEKEKELETMREKFNQLKQSRAKREEKIKSTSVEYDSDKGSDVGSVHSSETNESKTSASKTKQHGKKKKLIIASDSEDDESKDTSIMSIDKSHKMKSDDDLKSEDNSETEVRDSREPKLKMKGSKEKVNPKSEEDSSDIEIPVKNKEIPTKRHKGKGRKKHEKEIKIKSRKKSEEESSDVEGSARTKLHTIKKEKTKKLKCNEIRITDDESIESENKFTKESLNILDKLKLSKDEEKMEVISPEPEVKPRKNSTSKKETKKKKEKEVKPKEEFPEFETTDEEQEEKVKNNKRKRSRKLSRKEKKQEEKTTKIHSTFETFQTEEISEPEKVLEIPELKSTEDDKLQSDIMNIDKIEKPHMNPFSEKPHINPFSEKPHINPFSEDSISNFADLEKPILSCSLELDKSDSEPLMPALVSKEEEGLESGSGREPEDLPKFSELDLELNTKPTTLWTDEEFLSDEKELSIILPDKENTVTSQKSYDLNLEHESLLDVQQRKDVNLFESDDNMPTLLDGPIREDKKRKKSKKTSKEKKRKSKTEAPKLKDIYQLTNINMEEKESLIHEPEDVIEKPESSAESEAVKSIMADSAELVEAVRVLESQLQESLNENHEKNKMEELQNLQCQSDSNLQETEDEEKDLDASFHKELEESQSEDKEKDPELTETKQSPLDIFEFTDDDIPEIPARFGRDEHRRYRPSEEEQENRGRRHKGKKRRKTKEDKTKKEDLRIFRLDSKSEIDESLIDSIHDEKLEDKVALEIPELKIETSVNKTPVHDIIPDLIAATESIPPADLEPVHDVGKSMMDADPEPESETDKAVATISQEETEDAVKALLEATFGSETYGNQEAPILEEIDSKVEEEMTKLVEEEEVEEPPSTEVLAEPQHRIPETQERIPETQERIPETQERISETQERISETQDPIPETQVTIPETQDAIPETQDAIPETQDAIPETQDTIPEAEDRIPETQEEITEELTIKETEPSLPSEPNFHEDISIYKTDEEEEEEKTEEAVPSETSELNTSVEEPKVEAEEVPNVESSKEDEISLKPPELPVPEEEPMEVPSAIPEPVTNPTPEPEVVPDPTPEPEPEPVSVPDPVPSQNLEEDVKSPDFSEITIPEVKDEEPLSVPVMPPASALDMPVLDLEEKAQTPTAPLVIETRTRRGRRGKGRKYSDTSPVLKPEAVLAELQPTVTPIRQTGKRGRPATADKPRRTYRSEPEIIADYKDTYDMPKLEDVSQEPPKMEDENLEEVQQELAERVVSAANEFKELKEELPPVLIPSLEEVGKEAENLPTVQEKITEIAVIEKPEIPPVKVEECKNKRQRRKKKSEPTVTLHSPPMLEKIDLKLEEIGEEIKPKENRFETKLRLPEVKFSSELKDNKFKENRFDVFEFRDEDDDETVSTFESTKERKEELKFSDVRFHHEERKISHYESYGESVVEKQKKDDSEKFSEITVKEEKDTGPERTRPRLILTIKSPHKDSHEKVAKVETREEPSFRIVERVEESKSELVSERNTFSGNKNSHEDRHSQSPNKSPATRKSQRLQEKSYRTTVDEVIEDVVKGHFRNIDTEYEPAPFIRPTRRNTRSRGRIEDLPPPPPPPPPPEEKPEPVSLPQIQQSPTSVSDSNSKTESTDSAAASDVSVSPQSEANIVEPSKPPTEQAEVSKTVSLRTFRITRTQARAETMKAINEAHAIAVTSVVQSKGTENKETECKEDQKEVSVKTEPTTSDALLSSNEVKLEVGQTTSKVFYSENKVNEKDQVTPKAEFKTPSIVIQSPEAKTTSAENKSETKDKSSEKPVSLQPQLVMKVELPKVSPAVSTKTSAGGANPEDSQTTDEKETESSPTALVDPVTGFLTPVRQSEEGTYVPATSAGGQGSAAKDSREGAAPAKISQPPPSPCRSPVVVYSKSSTPQQSVSVQSQMLAPPIPHTTPVVRSPQPSMIPNLVPSTAASKSPRPQLVNSPQPYIKEEAEHLLPRSRSQSLPRVTSFVGEPPVDISARGRSQSVSGTPASHETDPRLLHPAMVSRPPGQIGQPMPGLPHAWLYAPSALPGPNSPAHQPGKASSPRPQTTVYQPLSKATLPSSLQSNPPVTVSPSLSKSATTLTTALNTGVIGMPPVATTASVVKTTCSSASKAQIPVTEIVQPSVRASDMTGMVLRPSSTDVIYKSEPGIPPPSSSSKAASSRTAPDLIPPRGVPSESSPSLPRGAPSSSDIPQPRLVNSKAQSAPSPKTSVQPRQSPVIPQQPAYPVPPYEAALHASHAYPPGSGGVIADLLQNPQYLLQQHKEYLSPHHSAGQLLERVPNQMMRPGTPVAVLPEVAARLGNPTPPHTPTPPTHTSITAQAEMIHLRHPSQPLVVHPHHPHVGVRHTADLPAAYMHQQMVYAAAHPHYASVLHPELRAQQAAAMQTRIPYSMSTGAAICHPVDSRAQVEAKPDTKDTRSEMKHPAVKEEKICERREERPVTADTSRSSAEGRSSSRTQQMQPVGQPAVRQPQAQYPPGVPPLRQVSPHLAISPHDRTTDSPIIANLYTQGQAPRLPYARPDQPKLVEVRGHEADPRSVAQSSVYLDPRPQMSAMPLMKQEAAASHPAEAHRPLPAQRPRSPTTSMRPPSPPPAHARSYLQSGCEIPPTPQPGSEAPHHPTTHIVAQPVVQPRTQPQTPPHASQVPPQGDSLLMLLQRYPVMWQGLLALKNDQAAVQMHFVSGNHHVALHSLPSMSEGGTPPLRIAQRMRLEQTQLEGVARRMQMEGEHCMLLALPCGRDHMDVLQQSNNLRNGFITYLQQKQAAGIVNVAAPGSQQPAYVVHIFPSCDFSNENLARIAPDLLHSVADIAHLLIVIATV